MAFEDFDGALGSVVTTANTSLTHLDSQPAIFDASQSHSPPASAWPQVGGSASALGLLDVTVDAVLSWEGWSLTTYYSDAATGDVLFNSGTPCAAAVYIEGIGLQGLGQTYVLSEGEQPPGEEVGLWFYGVLAADPPILIAPLSDVLGAWIKIAGTTTIAGTLIEVTGSAVYDTAGNTLGAIPDYSIDLGLFGVSPTDLRHGVMGTAGRRGIRSEGGLTFQAFYDTWVDDLRYTIGADRPTVCRMYPRDDGYGTSTAPRIYPPSKHRRLASNYDLNRQPGTPPVNL